VAGDRPSDLVDRAYRVGNAATAETAPAANRRALIRALGIIQIVLGTLCSAGFMMMFGLGSSDASVPAPVLLIYGIPAANLLLTGIASVKLATWARWTTLISAIIWLALIGFVLARSVWLGFRGMTYEMWLTSGVLLAGAALAIALIVAYTRPSVRATFERRQLS